MRSFPGTPLEEKLTRWDYLLVIREALDRYEKRCSTDEDTLSMVESMHAAVHDLLTIEKGIEQKKKAPKMYLRSHKGRKIIAWRS
tara:strand:+ start:8204 stop:8458 length:255 start_codon:yes stop_codon:yes gene_type:complete